MNAPQPETPVAAPEERIGNYKVHPVASMFPLLDGEAYEELRVSIETAGQVHPIIVMGDTLLDGRNRLRICLELEIEPRIEEYRGPLPPVDYIATSNLDRRHLSDDQRAIIVTQIERYVITQSNAKKQAAQGHHGAAGGRGHKKTLDQISDPGFTERDLAKKNANSTVGQVAEKAKVSRHKAEQAVAVAKAAPELIDQVAKGEVKLKDAAKKVKETTAPKQPESRQVADQASQERDTWIVPFVEELQCIVTKYKFGAQMAKDGSTLLHRALGLIQDRLEILAWLHEEIERLLEEAGAGEDEVPAKDLLQIVNWVCRELEKYKRNHAPRKRKAG